MSQVTPRQYGAFGGVGNHGRTFETYHHVPNYSDGLYVHIQSRQSLYFEGEGAGVGVLGRGEGEGEGGAGAGCTHATQA